MKSEHRHDLKTNELRKFAEQFGPFFERNGNRLLWGLAVVILAVGAGIYWMRSSNAAAATGWTRIAECRTAEDFANVADNHRQTLVGAWARLSEAESYLQGGVRLSFTDREAALSDLKKAKESFEKVLNADPLPEEVRERGLFGMARCLETMADADTSPAVTAYKKLIQAFPQSIFKELAAKRITALETGSSQEFYAWFHAQNPKPADRETPKDGQPDERSPLDPFDADTKPGAMTLPEIPDLLQLPERTQDSDGSKDSPKPK